MKSIGIVASHPIWGWTPDMDVIGLGLIEDGCWLLEASLPWSCRHLGSGTRIIVGRHFGRLGCMKLCFSIALLSNAVERGWMLKDHSSLFFMFRIAWILSQAIWLQCSGHWSSIQIQIVGKSDTWVHDPQRSPRFARFFDGQGAALIRQQWKTTRRQQQWKPQKQQQRKPQRQQQWTPWRQ